MANSADLIWANCLKIIKDIVEWQHYKTWFEPIQPVELNDQVLKCCHSTISLMIFKQFAQIKSALLAIS